MNRVIHVQRDGTILADGETIGYVSKVTSPLPGDPKWRAEAGDPRDPLTLRVRYDKTRKAAVRAVLAADAEDAS
jgi:hypothetical protein